MLVPMSVTTPQAAFCFHCGKEVDGDIMEHVSTAHAHETPKPKLAIKSWHHRLDDVMDAITEIQQESDKDAQIQKLDETLQELYQIRAALSQQKRIAAQAKKG